MQRAARAAQREYRAVRAAQRYVLRQRGAKRGAGAAGAAEGGGEYAEMAGELLQRNPADLWQEEAVAQARYVP